MRQAMQDVQTFHDAMGVERRETPGFPPAEVRATRLELLAEEMTELEKAEGEDDLTEVADALADLIYIALGTADIYGIPLDLVWSEVHRSNLAKLGPDGKAIIREDGKILKPEGWRPPDVAGILRAAG